MERSNHPGGPATWTYAASGGDPGAAGTFGAMRIAVAGGTGLVGGMTVRALERAGHDPVVIARSRGANTITGDGLYEALQGVEAVVDASNTNEL